MWPSTTPPKSDIQERKQGELGVLVFVSCLICFEKEKSFEPGYFASHLQASGIFRLPAFAVDVL